MDAQSITWLPIDLYRAHRYRANTVPKRNAPVQSSGVVAIKVTE
jgi:hypothetical protein